MRLVLFFKFEYLDRGLCRILPGFQCPVIRHVLNACSKQDEFGFEFLSTFRSRPIACVLLYTSDMWAGDFSKITIVGVGAGLGRDFAINLAREFAGLDVVLSTRDPRSVRKTTSQIPSNLEIIEAKAPLPSTGPVVICSAALLPELAGRDILIAKNPVELTCETVARSCVGANVLGFGAQVERMRTIEALSCAFGIQAEALAGLPLAGLNYSSTFPILSAIPDLESLVLETPIEEILSRLRKFQSFYSQSPEVVAAETAMEYSHLFARNPEVSDLRRAHLLIRAAVHGVARSEFSSSGISYARAVDSLISLVGACKAGGSVVVSGRLTPSGSFALGSFDFSRNEFKSPSLSVTERAMLAELTLKHRAEVGLLMKDLTAPSLESAL
jgi:hypothetical protein